jgi:hypothetical protein|tara:strand:+ start:365 stop:577 length:213 start_codon:yes stop_codon:yes gene_type:complete
MLLSHNTLANYYSTVFALVQHHKYSISEIENLIPYERDIYVSMLQEHLKKEKERQEQRAAQQRASMRKNY